jgi:CyaY protein
LARTIIPAVEQHAFEELAQATLDRLSDVISDALGEEADVHLQSDGVLVIEFEDGQKFVVNSHRVAHQIWFAAYASAWHFDPPGWTTGKGEQLIPVLDTVLTRKMGRPVRLPALD